jgi:hypothetical protein
MVLAVMILLSKTHSTDKFRALAVMGFIGSFGSVIALLNQIDHVKQNWNTYKCNPAIVPLAPMFGKDPFTTFTDCVKSMQANNIGTLVAPIKYNMSLLAGLGGELGGAVGALTAGAGTMAKAFQEVGEDFAGGLSGATTEMTRFVYNLRDSFGKIGGVMNTLLKVTGASVITVKSMGKACFSPGTVVRVNGGKAVPIKDVCLGDTMDGTGAVILATMRIKNTTEAGEQIETMYDLDGTIVSGSHLVYDANDSAEKHSVADHLVIESYVSVAEYAAAHNIPISREPAPELVCLITSNHTIPIGNYTFHDWEDNQGSRSKSIRTVKCGE